MGWLILRAPPHHEHHLAQELEFLGLDTYRPLEIFYARIHFRSRIREERTASVCPGLVFAEGGYMEALIAETAYYCQKCLRTPAGDPYTINGRAMRLFMDTIEAQNHEAIREEERRHYSIHKAKVKPKWRKLEGQEVIDQLLALTQTIN